MFAIARLALATAAFTAIMRIAGVEAGEHRIGLERGINREQSRILPAAMAVAQTDGLIFVADETHSVIRLYNPVSLQPLGLISDGISTPDGVAVDASNDLYVTNRGNHSVTEYAPPYDGAPIRTLTAGLVNPNFLCVTKTGVVYVSDYALDEVIAFQPGATEPSVLPLHGLIPSGLAEGPDGGLYVAYNQANFGSGGVIEFIGSGTGVFGIPLPVSVSDSGGIAFDAPGNLVIADQSLAVVVWPPHSLRPSQYIFNNFRDPFGVAFDAYKRVLFVSDAFFGTVQRIAYPAGRTLRILTIPTKINGVAFSPPSAFRKTGNVR